MSDEKINAFLVGELRPINVKFPKEALDALCVAIVKMRPELGRKKRGPITEAVLYFAARGFLDWEDQHREDAERKKHLPR